MRVKGWVIAGAMAFAGLAAPTAAQAGLNQCGTNYMCVWGNGNYEWLIAAQVHGQGSWMDVFNDANGENNQQDSWANRSNTYTGCMADDVDGGGDRITMAKASSDPELAWFNSNSKSAMRTKNGC